MWPGIFLGAFLTNEATAGSLLTSLLIAFGNTVEALLGGHLVDRFAGGRSAFDSGRNILLYVLLAGLLSTTVSPTVGVTSLSWLGFAEWAAYSPTWLTWWLGDASGALVVAPALLFWEANRRLGWSAPRRIELLLLFLVLVTLGWVVFVMSEYPVGFLCIPVCVWAGWRFGGREAATATCVLSAIAIGGSLHGLGTFGRQSPNEALLLLQAFMAVTSIIGITVGAAVSRQRLAEDRLRRTNSELDQEVRRRTSELQAAVDKLVVSEARLAEAQEVAHIGSWEWRPRDNQVWWSDEMYRVFGLDPDSFEISYRAFLERVHPDDRPTIHGTHQRCLERHEPFDCEHRIIRSDGEIRTIVSKGRAELNGAGDVVRLLGTGQDITSRKAAEEIVSRSERRLQTIIDAEPACVKLVSQDGVLLEMNRAGLQMVGAENAAQVVGRSVVDLVHPADRDRFLEMHRAASNGFPSRWEFRITGLNGGERWVDSHAVPFDSSTNGREAPGAVLSVTSDVTERKQLEEQLRLGHKMEAVGLLAGGVAHDFNNLLTAIGGYTELVLLTLDTNDPRHDDLLEVRKAAERASALTRQLLAVSRRQVLQTKVLDLNALVADVHKLLRRTIPENIGLELDLNPVLDAVRADRSQLEQVVMNLAVNAADAMPQGGQLRFVTNTVNVDDAWARRHPPTPPGRYVRLVVSDTGVGMTPETQARVFEPFFTTKERGKGTGLGLATVYGIVKQSGGFISVSSQLHRGTTFDIHLPAVQERIEPATATVRAPDPSRGSETILLAEDDGAVRRLARRVLSQYGYQVLDARDGDEALSIARQYDGPIHALVTDVVMPGLSGRQLADRLAKIRPDIRVLYSSGYTETITMSAGLERGLPFLAKPYPPTELLQKVREVLDGRAV